MNQINRGTLRVGDAEREEAARALGEHFASGRLDRDEYDERLDAAWRARTGDDLAGLFRDLPGPTYGVQRPMPQFVWPQHQQSRGFRPPFLPVLFLLIGLAILVHAPWVIWIGLGAFFLSRKYARSRHTSGRPRAARGSSW